MNSIPMIGAAPVRAQACQRHVQLVGGSVQAGFPSPAEDCSCTRIDISELLVEHEQATFLHRVAGVSMRKYGIEDGDLLVVDRAIRARSGHVVIAEVDGELTVKLLEVANGTTRLKAGNPAYPDILLKDGQTLSVWGVVRWCLKLYV